MIAGAGLARPLDTVEILLGPDDDHRNIGAARLVAQPRDEFGGLALRTRGGEKNKVGEILGTKAKGPIGIGETPGDRSTTERAGQAFQYLPIGDAVIDLVTLSSTMTTSCDDTPLPQGLLIHLQMYARRGLRIHTRVRRC
jgi:hypothetical protein